MAGIVHNWYIWNHERHQYWKSGGWGYTSLRHEAGRYTFNEALTIVLEANQHKYNVPEESMIPAEEILCTVSE